MINKTHTTKVAIVLPFFGDGGMERAMINLTKGLLLKNIEVEFVLLKKGYGTFSNEIPAGVKIVELNSLNFLTSIFKLRGYLLQEQPTVLLSLSTPANVVSIVASKTTRGTRRVIVSTQVAVKTDITTTKLKAMLRPLVYKIYNFADVVHVVSRGIGDDLESFGVRAEKIKLIYNPVISPEILMEAHKPISHPWFVDGPLKVPLVFTITRLVPQKDLPTLLRAFAIVRKSKNMRLAIIGEGPLRVELEDLAKELGIEKDFALLGFIGNPYPYINRANVFAISSAWEGFCVAIAEALAFGLPVVSTDCPHGPREVLENGKYGKLVPVGDAQSLAKGILESLENPLPREFIKEGAKRFTIESITEEYIKVF